MRKRITGRKFSRSSKSRRALLRALVVSLVNEGKITTTLAKAKEVVRVADKLFATAKKGDLSARRRILSKLANKRKVVDRIFELASKIDKKSGFVRFLAIPPRKGDNSPMAQVEIIGWFKVEDKKAKSEKEEKKDVKKVEKKNLKKEA